MKLAYHKPHIQLLLSEVCEIELRLRKLFVLEILGRAILFLFFQTLFVHELASNVHFALNIEYNFVEAELVQLN